MKFQTETLIDALPDAVWRVLTDVKALANADMGIDKIEGELELGKKIKLWAQISPDRAFRLTVSEFTQNERMVWSSGMPLGLFKGVRTFILKPEADGTRFTMEEEFSGLMLPLIAKSIPDLQPEFEKFANGLKRRCAELSGIE